MNTSICVFRLFHGKWVEFRDQTDFMSLVWDQRPRCPDPRGPLQIGRGRSEERAEVVFVSSTPLRSGQLSVNYIIIISYAPKILTVS